ncbi:MAG: agmatine deiminase family protein [Nitrospinae bacterium]|nr:agmatine deiminase family protein [Nitrospinota bacterium]
MTDPQYPADMGFRMPAEWEPHSGTWLAWPHNLETWDKEVLPHVEQTYLSIIQALAPGEIVHILVDNETSLESVKIKIANAGFPCDPLRFYIIPTDDAWIRDYGPNFLVSGNPEHRQIALNNWRFDSWGGKYDWELDDRAGGEIARLLKLPAFEPDIVLEGGAIDVNGLGTCLTTESCLLNVNRNGGLDRHTVENILRNYLEVKNIIWLKGEIEGDDTDGHIDNLARFVNPRTVVCACEEDSAASSYKALNDNYESLQSAADQDGNLLNVIRLPMPGAVNTGSTRLPASYANFYIGNRTVLLPVFNVPNDSKAESIIQKIFPDREVVPLPCRELLAGLGGLHCITQQQPA